jgi:riboflavin kinase/FMN adenylyltransferase
VTITLGGRRDVRVSSTLIRELLEGGDVAGAAAAMGRVYRLLGQVIAGRGKGRQLGFPTANLESVGQIIPAEGVYAGFVETGDELEAVCETNQRIAAALSVGRAATYGSGQPQLIEAHLLTEGVGPLAGKWMGMDFVERLRGQQKFESEKALSAQIAKDCSKASAILAASTEKDG